MNDDAAQNKRFVLRDVDYSEEARSISVEYNGRSSRFNLKRLIRDRDFSLWMISDSDVRDVFGESYFQGLGAFIGRLAEKCHSMNVQLPLRPVFIDEVRVAVDENVDKLNEIVDLAILGVGSAEMD